MKPDLPELIFNVCFYVSSLCFLLLSWCQLGLAVESSTVPFKQINELPPVEPIQQQLDLLRHPGLNRHFHFRAAFKTCHTGARQDGRASRPS